MIVPYSQYMLTRFPTLPDTNLKVRTCPSNICKRRIFRQQRPHRVVFCPKLPSHHFNGNLTAGCDVFFRSTKHMSMQHQMMLRIGGPLNPLHIPPWSVLYDGLDRQGLRSTTVIGCSTIFVRCHPANSRLVDEGDVRVYFHYTQ